MVWAQKYLTIMKFILENLEKEMNGFGTLIKNGNKKRLLENNKTHNQM